MAEPAVAEPAEAHARALGRAGVLLLVAFPVVMLLGAFMWRIEGSDLSIRLPIAWAAVAGPSLIAIVHTRGRLARHASVAFDPSVLARSGHYAAGALVGFFAFGYLGVLVGGPLVVAAGATLAVAWVRPEGTDAILTRLIGATLPFLLFIAGLNIDERPVIGSVLLAMAASALLRLWLVRRTSAEPPPS